MFTVNQTFETGVGLGGAEDCDTGDSLLPMFVDSQLTSYAL